MLLDWKTQEQNNTRQDLKQIASKSKINTGTTALERSVE